jgi:hypothetical protein
MRDAISKKKKKKVYCWASMRHENQFSYKFGVKLSLPCPLIS